MRRRRIERGSLGNRTDKLLADVDETVGAVEAQAVTTMREPQRIEKIRPTWWALGPW